MRTRDIRQSFVTYFQNQSHTYIPSAPLIPQEDTSLLFVNAGMVPFKPYFLAPQTAPYTHVVSRQKCLRLEGKHNDLSTVGRSPRHHTFFEMLGHFSFGSCEKEKALNQAWTFLTKILGLKSSLLRVTVHHKDQETQRLWKTYGTPILTLGDEDNFWSMGDTGPCGPCTEIFYYHEAQDTWVELWNLVFMEFHRETMHPLEKKCLDTGMGLERLSAVLQNTGDNFQTDTFTQLFRLMDVSFTHVPARIVADHLRSIVFLCGEGLQPGPSKQGFVLRRLMRRCFQYGKNLPQFSKVAEWITHITQVFQDTDPYLNTTKDNIVHTFQREQQAFETLQDTYGPNIQKALGHSLHLTGAKAFYLYDTHGIPWDVIEDTVTSLGKTVSYQEFCTYKEEKKTKAHSIEKKNIPVTFVSTFTGYTSLREETKVKDLLATDNVPCETLSSFGYLVTETTPFYGESGGQKGDTGTVHGPQGEGLIVDTFYQGSYLIHQVKMHQGYIAKKDTLTLQVDPVRRQGLKQHHSATHLLHQALQDCLGPETVQRGSLVSHDGLRFDFHYPHTLTAQDLKKVEATVQSFIQTNVIVTTQTLPYEEAMRQNILGLFTEKYHDHVRVVSMGHDAPLSQELCKGTHVNRTGDIGIFSIKQAFPLSADTKRIEAYCGEAALFHMQKDKDLLQSLAQTLGSPKDDLPQRLKALIQEKNALHTAHTALYHTYALSCIHQTSDQIWGNIRVKYYKFDRDIPMTDLRSLSDTLCRHYKDQPYAFILCVPKSPRVTVVISLNSLAQTHASAQTWVQILGPYLQGKGGGKGHLAQVGGQESLVPKALDHLAQTVGTGADH